MAKPGEITEYSPSTPRADAAAGRAEGSDQAKDAQSKLSQDALAGKPQIVGDQTEGRGTLAADNTVLTAEQLKMLDSWRSNENAIRSSNIASSTDGGAETQNGVYKMAVEELKRQGLDKQGWEALPVQDKSPLDKIGADIVLVNRKTGDMIFLDPTSRRLDPRTGEMLRAGEGSKNNVPALRQDGVVDALSSWFDKMSGNLKTDHENPVIRDRIKTFAEDFRFQVAELTSRPTPFNLKDFPLPSPLAYARVPDGKGETNSNPKEIAEIKAVSQWASEKASNLSRSGDSRSASDHRSFAQTVDQALSFTVREKSGKLSEAFHRTAAKVIVEDAIAQAYPNQPKPINGKTHVNLGEGNRIMIDKSGQLVADVMPDSKSESKYVITGGDAAEVFRAEVNKLVMVRNNPAKLQEFISTLPGSVQKKIERGEMSAVKILQKVEENRNAYSAGGAGVERPLYGRVVERLASGKVPSLRGMVEDVVPNEQKVAKAEVVKAEVIPETPKVLPEPVKEVKERPVAANNNEPPKSRWDKPAPNMGSLENAASTMSQTEKTFVPLSASEVQKLREERIALERKGQLTPEESHQKRALQFAERELTKAGNEPWKADLISHLRKTMRGEARGASLGVAIIGSAALSWIVQHQGPGDPTRAKFGEVW